MHTRTCPGTLTTHKPPFPPHICCFSTGKIIRGQASLLHYMYIACIVIPGEKPRICKIAKDEPGKSEEWEYLGKEIDMGGARSRLRKEKMRNERGRRMDLQCSRISKDRGETDRSWLDLLISSDHKDCYSFLLVLAFMIKAKLSLYRPR